MRRSRAHSRRNSSEEFSDSATHPYWFASLLGLHASDWPDLLDSVGAGLPFRSYEKLVDASGLSEASVMRWLQLAPRTLQRRKQHGRFDRGESDRLLRAARLLGKAIELFEGNREQATEWLASEQPALGGRVPLSVADTDLGAREVENLMGRLEHGVFS